MKKDIYDMLNDSDINLVDYGKEEFNDIEKGKIKSNFRKSIKKKRDYRKGTVAATLAIGLTLGLFGTNTGNQVLATINIIGSDIATRLGIESNLEDYKTVVDKSVTKDGITIKLNEVVLDGEVLIVSSTLKTQEFVDKGTSIHADETIYINGKNVTLGGGGSVENIDGYTMESVMEHNLDTSELNGDLDIEIVYKNVFQGEKVINKGPWKFEFKTNGDELQLDTQVVKLNNKFTLDNGDEVTIEEFTSNEVGQKINYSKTGESNEYDIKLGGEDDLGNKVEFYIRRSSADGGTLYIYNLDGLLSSEAKTITLTPYAVEYPEESGRANNDFKQVGEEFIIDISK